MLQADINRLEMRLSVPFLQFFLEFGLIQLWIEMVIKFMLDFRISEVIEAL